MNVGIIGYGRMGREVEEQAKKRGHSISARFSIDEPFLSAPDDLLNGTDVLIDFSVGETVIGTLGRAASLGIPIVEGTTGWTDQLGEASQIEGLTMVYSPNFSLGVYQFMQIVREASERLSRLPGYDVYVHEWHHSGKLDSPSGTAERLAQIIIHSTGGKDKMLCDSAKGKIDPSQLHVTSTRVGRIPGTHEVGFESEIDSIQLRHTAHGRESFAFGAVLAAEWIARKAGVFTMEQFVEDLSGKD